VLYNNFYYINFSGKIYILVVLYNNTINGDLKKMIKKFRAWRYKTTKNGYKFDKLIINIGFCIVMFYFLFIIHSNNYNFSYKLYYKCESPQGCYNPFYEGEIIKPSVNQKAIDLCVYEWCKEEHLPAGFEFGEKPKDYKRTGFSAIFLIMGLSFLINHVIYNNNYKRGFKK